MRIDQKLEAMTLNEILVVMILTTLVVGMAFSVLRMVQRHMWSIETHLERQSAKLSLEQALWIDVHRYNTMTYHDGLQQLQLSNELDSLSYRFYKDYVVKKSDTFKIRVPKKQFFFNGNPVSSGPIDAVKLSIGDSIIAKKMFIYKRKSAHQFIK